MGVDEVEGVIMDKISKLQVSISELEGDLASYKADLDQLSSEALSVTDDQQIDDLAGDIMLTKTKIQITDQALAEHKRLLQAEYDRQASPGYKQAVRSMSEILSNNSKRVSSIRSQVEELISSLDDLDKACGKYYQLSRQIGALSNIRLNPDLMRLWSLQNMLIKWDTDVTAYHKHKSLGQRYAS